MDGILIFGGLLTFLIIAYFAVFELGVLLQGLVPVVRDAQKNPRFGLLTALIGVAVFAVAFTLVRETGIFEVWHNTLFDYVGAMICYGISLFLALGLACGICLLFAEAKSLVVRPNRPTVPPDFHFLEQSPDFRETSEFSQTEPIAIDTSSMVAEVDHANLIHEFPLTFRRFDYAATELVDDRSLASTDSSGPSEVDVAIRQALVACWQSLPSEHRTFETIEGQIRRLVDRALADYRQDCQECVSSNEEVWTARETAAAE